MPTTHDYDPVSKKLTPVRTEKDIEKRKKLIQAMYGDIPGMRGSLGS